MYVSLHAPGWLYVLGIPPRADLPLSTPRERATDLGQGPNLRAGSERAPCVPRNREHEKRPAAGRAKNAEGPKKLCLYVYIYICTKYWISLSDVYRASKLKTNWCLRNDTHSPPDSKLYRHWVKRTTREPGTRPNSTTLRAPKHG